MSSHPSASPVALALMSTAEKTALTIPGADANTPALVVSQAAVDAASERAARGAASRYAARYLVAAMLPAIITERKADKLSTGKAQAMCLADSAGLVKAALAPTDSKDRQRARAALKRGAGCIAPKSAVALALATMTDEEVGS